MIITWHWLSGCVVGFEAEQDPDTEDDYIFIYLFLFAISLFFPKGDYDGE